MIVEASDLAHCLGMVNTVRHDIALNSFPSESASSIPALVKVCQETKGVEIEFHQVDSPSSDKWLLGACIVNDGKVQQILFANHLNRCWRRFVLCKEMMHLLIDCDDYRNPQIFAHLQEISLHFPIDDSRPSKPVVAEFLAEVAALEYLFPYKIRSEILAQGNVNFQAVAEQYRVPVLFVERYLSEGYMAALKV